MHYLNMTLDEQTDYIFSQKYMVEAQHISYDIMPIAQDIFKLVINNLQFNKLIYTGYNWDFDKKEFVKLNDNNSPYALYINIIELSKSGGNASRNISQEHNNTDIIINVADTIPVKYLRLVIRHELQHCKEMYILKDKNVLQYDKTTVYNYPKFGDNFKKLTKDLFYPLSNAEQHAILQEVHDYVFHNKNITESNLFNIDTELENIIKINKFWYQWRYFINFIGIHIYYIDLTILNIGYILKTNFNYKNDKLTKSYLDLANDNKLEQIDISILMDIMNFLNKKISEFQRKVIRTIYLAIQDRNEYKRTHKS